MASKEEEPPMDAAVMFDVVMGMLKSEEFQLPVNNFIEENCMVFDNDSEHKLEHSGIHDKFIELLEGLLEGFLSQLGIAPEQFAAICNESVSKNLSELIQSQILAMDDFLTFKKMMSKANMELELEAVRSNRRKAGATSDEISKVAVEEEPHEKTGHEMVNDFGEEGLMDETDEAAQIAEAIRLSQLQDGSDVPPSPATNSNIEEAIELSKQVADDQARVLALEMKREEADLEMALAMSLQLEEERIRMEEEAKTKAAAAEAEAKKPAAVNPVQTPKDELSAPPPPIIETAPVAPPPLAAPAAAMPAPVANATAPVVTAVGTGPPPLGGVVEPAGIKGFQALPALRQPKTMKSSEIPAVFGAGTSQKQLHDEVRVKQAELLAKQAGNAAKKSSDEEKTLEADLEIKRRENYLREQRDKIKAKKAAAEEPWKAPYVETDAEGTPMAATAPANNPHDMRKALAQRFKQDMLARKSG